MQEASSQKSSYNYQKYQNFVLENIDRFHRHGKFQTFDLCSFPSNLTEVTKNGKLKRLVLLMQVQDLQR